MRDRRLVVLLSLSLIAGGAFSAWNTADCPEADPADGCVTVEAYRNFWTGEPASRLFRDAVVRDPASPYRWFDFAEALLADGDKPRAAACSQRALTLGPTSPAILLRAINFAILTGSKDDALHAAARLLDLVPGIYDVPVFEQLRRAGCDSNDIQQQILTRHPGLSRRYLAQLMSRNDAVGAASTWDWMKAHGLADAATEREYRRRLQTMQRPRNGSVARP